MKIRVKTLTPVHIGNGDVISPAEYISIDRDNKITYKLSDYLCKIDLVNLFKDPLFNPFIELFINKAKNNRYIGYLIEPHSSLFNSFRRALFNNIFCKIPISQSAKNSNTININQFIKSAGRIFIPGSSLKGCLLSAVMWKVGKEKNIKNMNQLTNLMEIVISESSVSKKKNKFSRWLDISDSDLKYQEEVLEVSLVLATGGKRTGIPLLYETLKTGITFDMELKTSVNSFYKFGKLEPEVILEYADEFYRNIYKKFNYSFKIPENEYLVRIGQGSSVLATSFLLLAEENKINNYNVYRRKAPPLTPGQLPKTQKLVGGKIPMGWISVKIADK